MTLEEFYTAVGGDLASVRGRLVNDDRISKFLGIFFQDPTYNTLVETYSAGDLEGAFRAAHTLKGIGRDLGLVSISEPASELADMLRPNADGVPSDPDSAPPKYEQVKEAYDSAYSIYQNM